MENKKQEVAIGVVIKDNRFLLIKRKKQEGKLLWAFPGGKIEPGETEIGAVLREVYEETRIQCIPVIKIGKRVHPDSGILIHCWLCEFLSGEIIIDKKEVAESQWMTAKEVFKMLTSDIYPPLKNLLEKM